MNLLREEGAAGSRASLGHRFERKAVESSVTIEGSRVGQCLDEGRAG